MLVYQASFVQAAREHRAAGEARYGELCDADEAAFLAWVRRLADAARGGGLPAGWVPSSTFWLVRGTEYLATSRLRHRLSLALLVESGHIGYDVRPSARLQGNGTLLLRLTLERARALGLQRVLVTCDVANLGSAGVIENNGGRLENRILSPTRGILISRYWIDFSCDGARDRAAD